ncbi:sigma-70 family RNA polymerase sigma factor [Clostridium nigeriense]|uniref:sigma-70 family RNA polymerase sigma factor n=1 Tax=Clostridium nigeriense TaxID=1805470 RepID=UPI003D34BDEC
MENLIIRAKNNDNSAKEEIINMYYPLIVKESKRIFLKNRTFEDIVQIGAISILNSIRLFDLSRGVDSFSSYVLWSIKNGFINIIRSEAKYNDEISLNVYCKDTTDVEIVDSLIDENIDVEDIAITSAFYDEILFALNKLDIEEREIIKFLYIDNDTANLSKYARFVNKDYYYCSCLKKRALEKLRHFLIKNEK